MNALVDIATVPVGPVDITAIVVGVIISLVFGVGRFIWFRLLMGEHYRKSTPNERRWLSGAFVLLPIWGWLFVHIGSSYLDRAGPVGIWFYMMSCGLVGFLWLWVWSRLVPAKVSWWVAGFVWTITLWLAFTNRFV
jgi:hypothetical protein